MGKCILFFDHALSLLHWEQLWKVFEDVDDETPTSVEINFLHKIESATNTSCLLWDCPTVKDMDTLFSALYEFCFYGPDQPILTDGGKERLV